MYPTNKWSPSTIFASWQQQWLLNNIGSRLHHVLMQTLIVCMSTTLQHFITVLRTTTLLLSLQVMGEAAHSMMTQIEYACVNLCQR